MTSFARFSVVLAKFPHHELKSWSLIPLSWCWGHDELFSSNVNITFSISYSRIGIMKKKKEDVIEWLLRRRAGLYWSNQEILQFSMQYNRKINCIIPDKLLWQKLEACAPSLEFTTCSIVLLLFSYVWMMYEELPFFLLKSSVCPEPYKSEISDQYVGVFSVSQTTQISESCFLI